MGAAGIKLLHQLVAMGSTSLLQYTSTSVPYAGAAGQAAVAKVLALAAEERDVAAHFIRFLQKHRLPIPKPGSFPSHFTTGNFVALDYLLPKLIAEHDKEIAQIESWLSEFDDLEAGKFAQEYADMKRRHLQILRDLTAAPAASAA